jgi:diaminopimelate decarboxylase
VRAHPAGPLHGEFAHERAAPPALPASHDLAAIDCSVWPGNAARRADGVLTLAGADVRDLAAEFGTPLYVIDEDDFRRRCRDHQAAFADADVFYAGKALLTTAIAKWVGEEGLGLDVCSGGELAVALRAGFAPDRIAMHGNNKSSPELAAALDAGVGRFVLDSFEEIARLAFLAEQRGARARVLVRVTVGVEAHTHEYIATAHEDQKFGFSLASGAAAEAVRRVLRLPSLELVGLHSHIGSQIFDAAAFEVSAHRVVGLLAAIRDEFGVELPELDLGGGFGMAYTTQDDPQPAAELAAELAAIVGTECQTSGIAVPRVSVEPGRAIAGPSTFTLYEVGTVKPVELDAGATRTYVAVDGGMSDNIRAALYGADYSCTLAGRSSDAPPVLARVVGKHCESGDIVVKDEFLPADVRPGDLLAVPGTGAYARSMASTYNHVPRPPVVAVRDGQARVIVRRETEDDLLRLEME